MTSPAPVSGLVLRSLVTAEGVLELSLAEVPTPTPGPDEVVVRIEATPINPSDLGLLLAGADPGAMEVLGTSGLPVLRGKVPPAMMRELAARIGEPMPVGNEGAGVVVAAGSGDAARALLGKTVSIIGGAAYAQYRCLHAAQCQLLPDGTTPEQGASWFVNPMTALAMVETMRREGHTALVHTAAASNLGQMLQKICLADGVNLVNIVRRPEQAQTLRALGAQYICDSSSPRFMEELVEALSSTSATIAFDAIGGGKLAGQILTAMEAAANRNATSYSRYGSSTFKQVYIYGSLDRSETVLKRSFGFAWSVGGFLLTPFLQKAGAETIARMRQRVARELATTFASHYAKRISLHEALDPQVIASYGKQATGEKYLITPHAG